MNSVVPIIHSFFFKNIIFILFFFSISLSATLIVPTNFPNIQAGIDAAVDGDTVLVLDGVYSGEGNIGIILNSDERMLHLISENGPDNTIIDCQNQYRFLETNSDITIKGFSFINGISQMIRTYNNNSNIFNCIFYQNQEIALDLLGNEGEVSRCIFYNNQGPVVSGTFSNTIISHCLFVNNIPSTWLGSIMYCGFGNCPEIYNSILLGSIAIGNFQPILINCIYPPNIFSTPDENDMPDPLFVNAENGDFHLLVESPAINAGTTDSYDETNYFTLDPDGTLPDIGVYPYYLELLGDSNFDNTIDVLDIVFSANVIWGNTEPYNAQFWAMDINSDIELNVLDIVLLVDIIISQ